jgi:hypothetical protein
LCVVAYSTLFEILTYSLASIELSGIRRLIAATAIIIIKARTSFKYMKVAWIYLQNSWKSAATFLIIKLTQEWAFSFTHTPQLLNAQQFGVPQVFLAHLLMVSAARTRKRFNLLD